MAELRDITRTDAASLDEAMLTLCRSVTKKRARIVIDHILEHGIITNEELSELYGYDHPPRAVRDVRENGIPLITHKITSPKTGRQIGAYTFDDISKIKAGRVGGRKAFSKQFKRALIMRYGCRDAITHNVLDERYLQIDHRVPYEVAGDDNGPLDAKDYMLLDASSNRAKSWSCEYAPPASGPRRKITHILRERRPVASISSGAATRSRPLNTSGSQHRRMA